MATEARFVDLTYRGLKVAARARLVETGKDAAFVEIEAPLPVGSRLMVGGDVTSAARVVGVVEQESGAKSPPGMRLALGAAAAVVARPAPAPPPPVPSPPPAPEPVIAVPAPAVVVSQEVIVAEPDSIPEPAEPGHSGGFSPDEGAGPGGSRKRNRKKTQIGRP
jgi:hypothetical protein